ncbi:glycosyltransferase family 4 protein [Nitrospira sp. M1]
MHIGVLSQYYPPEIGAPQKRLSELAAHFVRRGHSVTILTAMPNYPTGKIHAGYGGVFRRESLEGMTIIRTFIFPTNKTGFLPRLTNYFSFVLSSVTIGSFCVRPMDYLLVESPPLFLGLSGIWLSRIKSARLIFNVSDLWPESAVQLGVLQASGLAHRLSARLEALCYRHAWLITGQSKGILASIAHRFPDRHVYHLSNGVDTKLFYQSLNAETLSSTRKRSDKFSVTYAGLHGLAQGLEQLIHAADALRSNENIVFHLIGDGPEKQKLVDIAEQRHLTNILFANPQPSEKIPMVLTSSDAIIVPLKMHISGAVPSKLYEAMASGRPVILVASGEAAEIVKEHQAGIVVEPGDQAELVRSIVKLYEHPDLCQELGKNGQRAAVQHFDRSNIADRFMEYLSTQ